ncbi:MAG: hypothetical protein ISR90_05010 [Candidatus Marinimicrobia bacterium]|nr:hypothetical protein [Candidatus Neomarinimicrobiota bacterium]MBL7023395.1 hypothetical protein [Candidatus Neomarinimicrobiota bacterium]MBL7109724.1 hypothetical protein [Candidatus Neomarinimicrobiota bacterium]
MFITLLSVTFIIALVVSFLVSRIFSSPILKIMNRIISDEISKAWVKYLQFAVYVVGISSGVRVWDLEKYIIPTKNVEIITLNADRWILEIYRTVIGSLIGLSWMLLVFFMFALIAFVIVRGSELKTK